MASPDQETTPSRTLRLSALLESIRNGLWFIPTAMVAATSLLALVLDQVDDTGSVGRGFRGDASSAQTLLSTIAASTLTMTTLVVSITVVALQLASQQFSPRVMRTFFRDRGTKVALGVFLSTTVYALLVLRQVVPGSEETQAQVPALSISVGFLLMLCSLATFLYFLNHVAHAIRAVHIMESVAAETRAAIRVRSVGDDRSEPGSWPDRDPDLVLASEQPPGSIVGIDEQDLVEVACRCDVQIEILSKVGSYLPSNAPLAHVWRTPSSGEIAAKDVVSHVSLDRERSLRQDVAFGLRQLVDMAEKALSPGINDPTTAVQALDRIHDLLRRIAVEDDPTTVHFDGDGRARLVLPTDQWDDLVHLACDEIRQYGESSIQVQARLRTMLDDLDRAVADRPERREVLVLQQTLIDRAIERGFSDPQDRAELDRLTGRI